MEGCFRNNRFHAILSEIKKQIGYGAVLNTSFNERGMPNICEPELALAVFLRCDIDFLVINNFFIEKKVKS